MPAAALLRQLRMRWRAARVFCNYFWAKASLLCCPSACRRASLQAVPLRTATRIAMRNAACKNAHRKCDVQRLYTGVCEVPTDAPMRTRRFSDEPDGREETYRDARSTSTGNRLSSVDGAWHKPPRPRTGPTGTDAGRRRHRRGARRTPPRVYEGDSYPTPEGRPRTRAAASCRSRARRGSACTRT